MANPVRTSSWSSTSTTRITSPFPSTGRCATTAKPSPRGPADRRPPIAATRSRMPISPCPAEPSPGRRRVVGDRDVEARLAPVEPDGGRRARPRVPDHVRQRLLHHAVRGQRDRPVHGPGRAGRRERHRCPGRAHPIHQRGDVVQRRLRLRAVVRRPSRRRAARREPRACPSTPGGPWWRSPPARRRPASGSFAAANRPPSAWRTMTASEWATTSCISRAMRARSAAAACAARSARRSSARIARSSSASMYAVRTARNRPRPHGASTDASSAAGRNSRQPTPSRPGCHSLMAHSRAVVIAAPASATPSATAGHGFGAYAATAYSSTGKTSALGSRIGGTGLVLVGDVGRGDQCQHRRARHAERRERRGPAGARPPRAPAGAARGRRPARPPARTPATATGRTRCRAPTASAAANSASTTQAGVAATRRGPTSRPVAVRVAVAPSGAMLVRRPVSGPACGSGGPPAGRTPRSAAPATARRAAPRARAGQESPPDARVAEQVAGRGHRRRQRVPRRRPRRASRASGRAPRTRWRAR